MTYRPRRACRRCDRDRDEVGGVSHSGLCRECGPIVQAEALEQIATRRGDHYAKWLEGMTAAVARLWGATLPPATIDPIAIEVDLMERERWPLGM